MVQLFTFCVRTWQQWVEVFETSSAFTTGDKRTADSLNHLYVGSMKANNFPDISTWVVNIQSGAKEVVNNDKLDLTEKRSIMQ